MSSRPLPDVRLRMATRTVDAPPGSRPKNPYVREDQWRRTARPARATPWPR